jgi:lysophospholipase L1-like esterase
VGAAVGRDADPAAVRRREDDLTGPEAGFFGDSDTAGHGDPAGLGWVDRVAASVPGLTAYHGGVPGDAARRRLGEAGSRPRLAGVVLAVGTNDVPQGIPLPRTLAVLGAMLDAATWPVLVVGPPPAADGALTERLTANSS